MERAEFREGDLDDFRRRLIGSDPLSIDTFLEGAEPEFVKIGKAAIASIILRVERACKEHGILVGSAPEDHWLRYVWNLMRDGTSPTTFARDNKISFVTFNYERTIEYYFETVLRHTWFDQRPDWAKARELVASLPIVHPHGYPSVDFGHYLNPQPGVLVRQAAEGIRVIHDAVASGDPNFDKAHEWLSQAEQVCFLGFGYHPVNIARLQLKDFVREGRPIIGGTYRMGEAQVRMARYRISAAWPNVVWGTWGAYQAEQFLKEAVPLL